MKSPGQVPGKPRPTVVLRLGGLFERRPQGDDSVQVNPAAGESVYIRPRNDVNSLALELLPPVCVAERGSHGGDNEWKNTNNIEGGRVCTLISSANSSEKPFQTSNLYEMC